MNFWEFVKDRQEILVFQGWQHALMVIECVFWAAVIAVAVGILVYKSPAGSGIANALSAVGLTIPSFALLGILIIPFGLGILPSWVALCFYAVLPILRNAIVGLAGVDQSLIESARGMGMGRFRTLFRVELPMAWPVILAGIRVSTQMIMGIAAIAAYVNGPGLGGLIFSGLAHLGGANAVKEALVATIGIVILALILDGILQLIGRITTPRGIRV
ncbi:MAG: ABC transporter permease [Streptosporangiales bacterium]